MSQEYNQATIVQGINPIGPNILLQFDGEYDISRDTTSTEDDGIFNLTLNNGLTKNKYYYIYTRVAAAAAGDYVQSIFSLPTGHGNKLIFTVDWRGWSHYFPYLTSFLLESYITGYLINAGIRYNNTAKEFEYLDQDGNWQSVPNSTTIIKTSNFVRLTFSINLKTGKYESLKIDTNDIPVSTLQLQKQVSAVGNHTNLTIRVDNDSAQEDRLIIDRFTLYNK